MPANTSAARKARRSKAQKVRQDHVDQPGTFQAPHAPYAPGAAPGRSAEDRYDDEVAAADREIARLLDAWRSRPLDHHHLLALYLDGVHFGPHCLVVALGVDTAGQLRYPNFVEITAVPGPPASNSPSRVRTRIWWWRVGTMRTCTANNCSKMNSRPSDLA